MGRKCHVQFHIHVHICSKYPVLILIMSGYLSLVSPKISHPRWDTGTTKYLFEQLN